MDVEEIFTLLFGILVVCLVIQTISSVMVVGTIFGVTIDPAAEMERFVQFAREYWYLFAIGIGALSVARIHQCWALHKKYRFQMECAEKALEKYFDDDSHDLNYLMK